MGTKVGKQVGKDRKSGETDWGLLDCAFFFQIRREISVKTNSTLAELDSKMALEIQGNHMTKFFGFIPS